MVFAVFVLVLVVCGGDEKCSFPFMTLSSLSFSRERYFSFLLCVNSASAFRSAAAFCLILQVAHNDDLKFLFLYWFVVSK